MHNLGVGACVLASSPLLESSPFDLEFRLDINILVCPIHSYKPMNGREKLLFFIVNPSISYHYVDAVCIGYYFT